MSDDEPDDEPPTPPPKPPLIDYMSRPTAPPEPDSESWPEVFRAMAVVFSILALVFFFTFGICGVLTRGCG